MPFSRSFTITTLNFMPFFTWAFKQRMVLVRCACWAPPPCSHLCLLCGQPAHPRGKDILSSLHPFLVLTVCAMLCPAVRAVRAVRDVQGYLRKYFYEPCGMGEMLPRVQPHEMDFSGERAIVDTLGRSLGHPPPPPLLLLPVI